MAVSFEGYYQDQGGSTELATIGATGTDRLLLSMVAGRNGSVRTLNSKTIDGISCEGIETQSIDGGTASITGIGHIKDANYPTAGGKTVAPSWSGSISELVYTTVELSGVDQTTPVGTTAIGTATSVADGGTVSCTLNGHDGNFAVVFIATADGNNSSASGGHGLPAGAVAIDEYFYNRTRINVGYISSISGSSAQLDFTASMDGASTIDSVVVGAIPVNAVASREITSIGGDNSVAAGETVGFVGTDLATPFVSATLGGETVTLTGAETSTSGSVIIPAGIDLKWGRSDLDFILTDQTGALTLSNVTLTEESGWEYVNYSGVVPNPVTTESFHEYAQTDATVGNLLMLSGDQLAWDTQTGLSIDVDTYPTIVPPATTNGSYKIWDESAGSWTATSTYTITDGGDFVVPPVLTSPTGTATAYNTADGTVSTDTGTGTLYYLFSENAVESIATVKASGDSQAVSATGVQNVSVTGLTGSTTYYAHYVHTEGGDSLVATSASFSTPAAPDVTPPVLTLPTGTETGETTADGSVTTNEGNGTLYYYVSENASETAATIKASGQSQAVVATGVQNVSVTGLTASTTYYFHFVQDDSSTNESNTISSASFTTSDTTAPVLTNAVGQSTGATTANIRVTTDEGNGTLYYLVSQNASETAIAIKAGSSQAVTATGVQNIPVTGLTEGLTYYAHFVQDDAATNESNVISSSSFIPEEVTLLPGAANEQLIAFFRAQTGSNSYQFNELAKIYYKQVAATQGAFNDLLQAAQESGGFIGYAPIDWRNF